MPENYDKSAQSGCTTVLLNLLAGLAVAVISPGIDWVNGKIPHSGKNWFFKKNAVIDTSMPLNLAPVRSIFIVKK